ncbi:MAG: translation initiation factor IF-2 [Candidatus Aenigmatarchaeota archaeon]
MKLRAPIVTLMGHVDHGKTSLADAIRNTKVAELEAGQITQHISSTFIPKSIIEYLCSDLLKKFKFEIKFNGLLLIDTPGHAAFVHLRKRGGSVADLAILVIDIIEGIKEQTIESINILKDFKIPFLVAATKIDKIEGWKNTNQFSFSLAIEKQSEKVAYELDKRVYNLVAELYNFGFESERFDRVTDFRKQIAIVPVSSKTKEGIAEILLILTGLAQIFLKDRLTISNRTRGIVLEIKEVKGLGKVADCILFDGELRKNDIIVFAAKEPIVTKVKAILIPRELQDIKVEKKFQNVDSIVASAGIRIIADNLENVIPGTEFEVAKEDIEKIKEELRKSFEEIEFNREIEGVILKAESIGSLEAMINFAKKLNIPIKRASIGKIKKEDLIELELIKDLKYKVILAFNIEVDEETKEKIKSLNAKIFSGNVIYRIFEEYENFLKEIEKYEAEIALKNVTRPVKIKILQGYIFRRSNPAIFGIEVIKGCLQKNSKLKIDNKILGNVLDIQKEKMSIDKIFTNERAAISMDIEIGKDCKENDILISHLEKNDIEVLLKYKKYLTQDEIELLKEFQIIA